MNIRFVGVLAAMVLPITTAMMACSDSSTGGGDAPPRDGRAKGASVRTVTLGHFVRRSEVDLRTNFGAPY